jgi:hypothetical protein
MPTNQIKKINLRFTVLVLMVFLAGLSRLVVHIDNFTPIGAMCLFGGAYFADQKKAYLMPLLSLFLSDMIIQGIIYQGKYGFPLYDGWYWVYGTFAILVLLGRKIITKITLSNVLLASIMAALFHWIITDFGVWISGCNNMYTKDLNGFILCYTMAIPYMLQFLGGTVLYAAIMFGTFEFAKSKFSVLAKSYV